MNKKKVAAIMAGLLAGVMVLSLLLGMLPGSVSAASSSEIQSQIDQLEIEQEELKQMIEDKIGANNFKSYMTGINDVLSKDESGAARNWFGELFQKINQLQDK